MQRKAATRPIQKLRVHCLEVDGLQDPFIDFDGVYDLPEQSVIRADCHQLVDKLANVEEERLSVESDLESTLTLFCKSRGLKYATDRGWLAILKPLIAAKLVRSDLYNVFHAIIEDFVARDHPDPQSQFHLFRLLLLYHDPELCRFLDTKKVSPDTFASKWFSTLFASHCDVQVVLNIWDVYFQLRDAFLVQFLALVIVINARDQILCMESSSKEDIADKLSLFPSALEAEDIEDFCSLAHYYVSKTPKSFTKLHHSCIYGPYRDEVRDVLIKTSKSLENALCLEVSVSEVIGSWTRTSSSSAEKQVEPVKFFMVDCRPAYLFKVGHLANSYHLNSHLMLQNPKEFNSKVQVLLTSPSRPPSDTDEAATSSNNILVNGGEHLCFVGEGAKALPQGGNDGDDVGGDDDDAHMNMVVSHFLQKHTQYVSVCRGGYRAIHDALKNTSSSLLIGHNARSCDYCNPGGSRKSSDADRSQNVVFPVSEAFILEKFGRFSSAFRSTSAIIKDKVVTYIKNEQQPSETHVSSSDKVGKRYRGGSVAPVFTIGDDDEEDSTHFLSSEEDAKEMVNIDSWVKKFADPKSVYECLEILPDSTKPSLLCLNENHLVVLRKVPEEPGKAWLQNKRSLCSILKITSKKRQPQFITIKYGAGGYAPAGRRGDTTKPTSIPHQEGEPDDNNQREAGNDISRTNGEADGLKPDQNVVQRSLPEGKEDLKNGNQDLKNGNQDVEGSLTVTAIDRFLISRAGEATKDIKVHIMRIVDMLES